MPEQLWIGLAVAAGSTGLLVWESEERGDPYPQSLPLVPAAGRLFVFDNDGSWLAYAPVP